MVPQTLVLALLIGFPLLRAQNTPAQPVRAQAPVPSASQRNPFEAVPAPPDTAPAKPSGPAIQAIEFRGTRRTPVFALRAITASRAGVTYDVEMLSQDAVALRNTGRFAHVDWESEPSPDGPVVRFTLVERPLIESIEFQGAPAITALEITELLEQRKVNLRAETLYNEDELPRATAAIQQVVAEKGSQNFTVTPLVERLGPPSTVKITFRVDEKR